MTLMHRLFSPGAGLPPCPIVLRCVGSRTSTRFMNSLERAGRAKRLVMSERAEAHLLVVAVSRHRHVFCATGARPNVTAGYFRALKTRPTEPSGRGLKQQARSAPSARTSS